MSLFQSIKCLLGFHKIALKRRITLKDKPGIQFVCIHCGKEY